MSCRKERDMPGILKRTLWIINHHAAGPGRHESLARELSARGWQVRLFAASFMHNVFSEQKRYPPDCRYLVETVRGIDRVWIQTPPYYDNSLSRLINHLAFTGRVAWLGRKMDAPEVIIGSSAHLFAGLAAYYLARKYSIPFVFEVRDFWPQSLVEIGALGKFSPLAVGMGVLEKFLYRKARLIISVLPDGKEHIARFGTDLKKVVHIPNGADLAWYDGCTRESRLSPELNALFRRLEGRVIFTYAGAHGYANGLETVIKAAEILHRAGISGVHVLMVGDGPDKPGLVKMTEDNGLTNVTFINTLEKVRIPVILKNSDVCLFHLRNSKAYRYGLSSNKLFDYMAAARPIIAAVERAPNPEFTGFGLHIPSDDPGLLADAMLQMAGKTPGARKVMGDRARAYAERFHDTSMLAGKLAEALESLAT